MRMDSMEVTEDKVNDHFHDKEQMQTYSDEFNDIRNLLMSINRTTKKRILKQIGRPHSKRRRLDTKYSGLKLNGKKFAEHDVPPHPLFTGYLCACCKTSRYRGTESGDLWYYLKHKNQWYCPPCGIAFGKKNACPLCGVCFSEDDSEEDTSNWIQCDFCSRWIMASCDGIEDLSLYDDDNPDHLEYGCPMCQNRLGDEPLIFRTKMKEKSRDKTESFRNVIEDYSDLEKGIEKVEKALLARVSTGKRKSKKKTKADDFEKLYRSDMESIRKILSKSHKKLKEENAEIVKKITDKMNENTEHLERSGREKLLSFFEEINQVEKDLTLQNTSDSV
eukprot:TRINITY_DN12168_c0_g1_i1.p1 TRINITY_DN12168_c0_g1~~TRINITY_DN12168_c0_g1_i1.p1  ORF type:complete len:333 (+),score=45.73 TRINITY_DN12168_c0_g1_i1:53-1051(+)